MTDETLEQRREQRVRERAYALWEQDGRPNGREAEFWERAEFLIGIEENPTAGQLPNPAAPGAPPPRPIAEEAAIQENYGETPGRMTDQGDRLQTPMTRKREHEWLDAQNGAEAAGADDALGSADRPKTPEHTAKRTSAQ